MPYYLVSKLLYTVYRLQLKLEINKKHPKEKAKFCSFAKDNIEFLFAVYAILSFISFILVLLYLFLLYRQILNSLFLTFYH